MSCRLLLLRGFVRKRLVLGVVDRLATQLEVRLLVLPRIEQPEFQLGLGQACEGQVDLLLLQVASRDRFLTN